MKEMEFLIPGRLVREDMNYKLRSIILIAFFLLQAQTPVNSYVQWKVRRGAKQLTTESFAAMTEKYELSLINFYHRDCPHSAMFMGVYDETADLIREEFPEDGKVLIAKIDCAEERSLIEDQDIVKFPTVRMFIKVSKFRYEYRGPRTIDGLLEYVRHNTKDPVMKVKELRELNYLNWRKRNVIGYFESESSAEYETFRKVAINLSHVCDFFAAIGDMASSYWRKGKKVVYREIGNRTDIVYTGSLLNYKELYLWTGIHKCVKLTSAMTLDKAEEAAEYQMPHLILFHHPDDTESVHTFQEQVMIQLIQEHGRVRFVTADATLFDAPLQRLGKSEADLPFVAIDTYQHMYLWPHDASRDLSKPDGLRQFVADLRSGRLHDQYHEQHQEEEREAMMAKVLGRETKVRKKKPSPVESQFVKLGPSASIYTFVQREEL